MFARANGLPVEESEKMNEFEKIELWKKIKKKEEFLNKHTKEFFDLCYEYATGKRRKSGVE